jgi:hypothetical protein
MKFTSKVLLALGIILVGALLCSNIILKHEYDKVDKSDSYWNYEKVLQQPFKYLKIIGGNGTRIAFEQSEKPSVRVLQEWQRYHGGKIESHVTNDTLFINFNFIPANLFEKFWMQGITAVRIFSPELLSVNGFNTNFQMFKLKQSSIGVNMSGKSKFEVESMIPELDSLNVTASDSSEVVFEMSPDYKAANTPKVITVQDKTGGVVTYTAPEIKSSEAMHIRSVNARLQGYTLLDLGHAQVDSFQLRVADSSAIILSGGALRKLK